MYFCQQDNETGKTVNGVSTHGDVSVTKTKTGEVALIFILEDVVRNHLSFLQSNRLNWQILVHGIKLISRDT